MNFLSILKQIQPFCWTLFTAGKFLNVNPIFNSFKKVVENAKWEPLYNHCAKMDNNITK